MTPLYIIAGLLLLPLIIWGVYAQSQVRGLFQKYSKEPIKKGITGNRLARTMLNSAGLNDVVIEEKGAALSSHYDPHQKVIRLSRDVSRNASVAAVGIAAHEAAHAIQDGTNFFPAKLRTGMAPIVEKASFFILPLLFLGIIASGIIFTSLFINLAIFLFLGIVIFYLVTLPVELEASSRAIRYIKENKIVEEKELRGIREVLRAAALTYIIAAALAIVQFLRLMGIQRR